MFRVLLIFMMLLASAAHAGNDIKALKKAAEQGMAEAQHNLGLMYARGEGIPENRVQAYAWFSIAAAQGDDSARDNKEIVAKNMTSAEIAEAQKLSRKYWEAYGPGRLAK